jgi:hypothetical protein
LILKAGARNTCFFSGPVKPFETHRGQRETIQFIKTKNTIVKMKTKNFSLTMIAAVALFISFATSCKKDDSTKITTDADDDGVSYADRFQEAEGVSSDVDVMSDEAIEMGSVSLRGGSAADDFGILSCATITNDTINQITTIDFGPPPGCQGPHHTRSGQIIIHHNGLHYFDTGYERIVTFNNYYVDDRHLEGTRTITNNGVNSNGHVNWTINAQNMRITKPNGNYHEWNSLRNREMISGDTISFDPASTVYSITGSSSGVNSNGVTCTQTITNALIKPGSCFFRIVSGTIVVTPSNKPQLTIDFGSGTCDDIATVTRNGVTHIIHIH